MIMHTRVILGRVKLDKREEAIRIYREKVMPATKEQQGFKSINLLTDPDTSKFISITIWETENEMIAGETNGYLQQQLDKLSILFVGPPTIQHFIVAV
jgi:heme-degrading monooxygenase HmoA